MDETDVQFRKSRNDVRLGKGCVQALVRDAVAIEDDPVAILEGEALRPGLQSDECEETKSPNEWGGFHAERFNGFGPSTQPGFVSKYINEHSVFVYDC